MHVTAALTLRVSSFSLLLSESPELPPQPASTLPIKPNARALHTFSLTRLSSIMILELQTLCACALFSMVLVNQADGVVKNGIGLIMRQVVLANEDQLLTRFHPYARACMNEAWHCRPDHFYRMRYVVLARIRRFRCFLRSESSCLQRACHVDRVGRRMYWRAGRRTELRRNVDEVDRLRCVRQVAYGRDFLVFECQIRKNPATIRSSSGRSAAW